MSKFLASMVAWVLEKIKTIQAAHRESARNALMRLLFALLTFKFAGDLWDSGSTSEACAIGVLADLLGKEQHRARTYAAEADEARAAGLTCERAYDAARQALQSPAGGVGFKVQRGNDG